MDIRQSVEELRSTLCKFAGSKRNKEDARLIRAWGQACALAEAFVHFEREQALKMLERIKKDAENF